MLSLYDDLPQGLLAVAADGRIAHINTTLAQWLGLKPESSRMLTLADVVYYRFFGDVLSTPAMLAAHQTGHVWGSVGSLFSPGLLWLLVDWPFAVWLAARLSRRTAPPGPARGSEFKMLAAIGVVLAIAGAVLSVPRVLAATPLDAVFFPLINPVQFGVVNGLSRLHKTCIDLLAMRNSS